MTDFKTIDLMGYPVTDSTMPAVVEWSFGLTDRETPSIIAVININKLWLARHDEELQAYLRSAAVVAPEYSVVWEARVLHGAAIETIFGVEYAKAALDYAARHGQRPFLLGARPEVSAMLQGQIEQAYPGIRLAGIHHGYLKQLADPEVVVEQIAASGADVLMVGMGSPLQEHWLWRHRHRLNVPVVIGVGGSFDVIAGVKQDTPGWIRGSGLEWAYRLILDPAQYWRRYLITNPWFLWRVLVYKLRG